MKLIPLDAVVAEIKRRYKLVDKYETNEFCAVASRDELVHLMNFINSLEVKEVDLDFMLHEYWDISPKICVDCLESATMTKDEMINFAKHFFELGVNVSNPLTWEDMRELHIIFESLDVDIELSRSILQKETLGYYEEVLKRFKAQKGE